MSNDTDDFCDEFAVKRGFTVPFGSPQNGQAERLWGVLQRCIRIVLVESGLPESFWHYAALHACWLHNHLPTKHNADYKSPYEMVFNSAPDFSKIRVFGCKCYVTMRDEIGGPDRPTRVSPTGRRAVHLGRNPNRNGWRIYIPELKRITTSMDVVFHETQFLRVDEQGDIYDVDESEHKDSCGACKGKHVKHTCGREFEAVHNYLEPRSHKPSIPPTQTPQHPPNNRPPSTPALNSPLQSQVDIFEYKAGDCGTLGCTLPDNHLGAHSNEIAPGEERIRVQSKPYIPMAYQATTSDEADPFTFTFKAFLEASTNGGKDYYRAWAVNVDAAGKIPIPANYDEAMASEFSDKWLEAMDREITELLGKNTWICTD